MHFLKSPKTIIALGAVVLVGVVFTVVWERHAQRAARRLPPVEVTLTAVERSVVDAAIAKAQAELADGDAVNDFNAYVELALARTRLGDREGAAEIYRTMNRVFVGNYLSYQNLGQLYEEATKCDLAAEQYRRAIANAPRNSHLYRMFVNLATYPCPHLSVAIPSVLTDGLAIVSDSIDLLAMMAVYHRDFGTIEDAIHWYELLLVHDQSNRTAIDEVKALKAKLQTDGNGS